MTRHAKIDKFNVAEKIIELARNNKELTVYNITKELRKLSRKNNDPNLDVRPESVRRILNELVRLKVLAEPSSEKNSRKGSRRAKRPYKLLWNPEKAMKIVQCWKKFHSLHRELSALKRLTDSKKQEFDFSDLSYKFCPYLVLLGISWVEGLTGFLGKFDWGTFLNRAIPLYGAVFSLRHDQELRLLNEDYVGGEFFVVSGQDSCRFFEEARWVEYVARRKAKTEIENKLLEMFYTGHDFKCASIHYGDGAGTLSNYILGVKYFIEDSRLVIFDLSPNPFLMRIDNEKITDAFNKLIDNLQRKHKKVKFIQVRAISEAMGEFLRSIGFEEREKFYLYIKTEKVNEVSRFIVELSKNPSLSNEREWIIRVFEKKVVYS